MIAPVPPHGTEPAIAVKPPVPLNGIDPVAAIKPAGGGRGEAQRFLLQLEPGQIVSGRVAAGFPDGSFKVEVDGQELRMVLPANIATGNTLELTFIGNAPRPTFTLQEPPPPPVQAPVLSAAGRLIAAMLPQPGDPDMAATASTSAPLFASAPADVAALSAALKHTLAQSGLFYEAHQAEWLAGKRDLAQILQEPQGRLARSDAGLAAPAAAAADLSSAAIAQRSEQMVHPQAAPLMQQQLAALDTARVVLQLEVWPRQWMQWEVEEHAPDAAREPGAPFGWHTQLRLDLPQLGELNATLTLGSDGMHIRLAAASAESATLLQDNRASLQASLAAAGVPPAAIAITRNEQP